MSPSFKLLVIRSVMWLSFLALIGYIYQDNLLTWFKTTPQESEKTKIARTPFVSAVGTKLYLEGEEYRFTGVNAYHLATLNGANAGCGGQENDLTGFMSKLRPFSVIRLWAFQGGQATNVTTRQIDWSGIDRVVNAAQQNNIKLILTLADQSGTCDDGHWKDLNWYLGGYKKPLNDLNNGLTPLSYLDYVKLIVYRYKDSTAIAMWEMINEPEASDCPAGFKGSACYQKQICPDEKKATKAMRSFFDTVGGTIKSIDKNHLISSGLLGDGQCGAIWENYQYLHQSDMIDVASYHDYQRDNEPLPGDQWNGLQKRLDQMKQINKPLIIGEVGIKAANNSSECVSLTVRKDKLKSKMDAQFAAGIAGFLPWSFTNGKTVNCNYDIIDDDPVLKLLNNYPLSQSSFNNPVPSSLVQFYTFSPLPSPLIPSPSPDLTPPTAPTLLTALSVTATQINLSWKASTDNKGVIRYDIFRNGSYLTSTDQTSFNNTGLTPSTSYSYQVKGKDEAGNNSPASNTLNITTLTFN